MKIPDYWITSKKEKFLEGNLTGIVIILVARQYVFYSDMILVLVYGISLAEFERQTSWQLVQSKVYLFMKKIGRNIIIPWWKSLTFFMHLAKGQMSFQHLFASVFGLPIILYLYHILVFSWNTSQTNSTKLGKRESLE